MPREGRPAWGFDLGQSEAMAACSAYWPASGRLETLAAFPRVPTLAERGLQDGVANLYVRMADRRELIQTRGEAANIGELVSVALEWFGPPVAISADRWRADELRDILNARGVPGCPFHERGQGFRDGGQDVRDFRRAMVEGKVRPVPSLLLSSAAAEARTVSDPGGNANLTKSAKGADDGGRRMTRLPRRPSQLRLGSGSRSDRDGATRDRVIWLLSLGDLRSNSSRGILKWSMFGKTSISVL